MSESDWEQDFDAFFTDIVLMEVKPGVFTKKRLLVTFLNDDGDRFKYFIRQLLSTQREQLINEMVNLSDRIELSGNTTTDEWRAFKHFRNTMRDLLSPTQEDKDMSNKINDYRKSKGYTDEQSIEKV